MTKYTRGNELIFKATFGAIDGTDAQPENAELDIAYTDNANAKVRKTHSMTQQVDGSFVYTWDSRDCKGGDVFWVAHCWNGLIAATQGTFTLEANRANIYEAA